MLLTFMFGIFLLSFRKPGRAVLHHHFIPYFSCMECLCWRGVCGSLAVQMAGTLHTVLTKVRGVGGRLGILPKFIYSSNTNTGLTGYLKLTIGIN